MKYARIQTSNGPNDLQIDAIVNVEPIIWDRPNPLDAGIGVGVSMSNGLIVRCYVGELDDGQQFGGVAWRYRALDLFWDSTEIIERG